MKYGLNENIIEQIQEVLSHFPEVEQALLYGSRAKGNYKNGSDIDLTFKGEGVEHDTLNKISLQLDDLYLPYTFDLSVFNHISNPDLIDHIKRVGIIFYQSSNYQIIKLSN